MNNDNEGNVDHDGRAARGHGAGAHTGLQHGSAAVSDLPAESVPTASPVDLASATVAAVNFGTSPLTRRRASDTGSPLLDAERRRRAHGENAPGLVPGDGRTPDRRAR